MERYYNTVQCIHSGTYAIWGEHFCNESWDVERNTTFITLNKIRANIASIINYDSAT